MNHRIVEFSNKSCKIFYIFYEFFYSLVITFKFSNEEKKHCLSTKNGVKNSLSFFKKT